MSDVGIVIIGRNEGERLRRCLTSVIGSGPTVVYVDSDSKDDSVALAQAMGAEVVALDLSRPFTAARARNEGFARLEAIDPGVRYVQFVDGDCEVVAGWLERARTVLDERFEVAVVCGRLRERFPDRSVYNRLADLEWDTSVGPISACGGIAMIRAEAFRAVGGFNAALIAGEEGELCFRLRQLGGMILRLESEMALHDMDMHRLGPWWNRSMRTGFTYAEGVSLHGRTPERYLTGQLRSVIFWGLIVPVLSFGLAWPSRGLSLILLAGYPVLYWRVARGSVRRGWPRSDAQLYAAACVLGKFPQALGSLRFALDRLRGGPSRLIEHKGLVEAGTSSPR
jgi:glycosyltransferase involved in cell wall biosynthesis